MAYATKFQIDTVNPQTTLTESIKIKEDGFSGSITYLDPGPRPISVKYRSNKPGPDWWRASSQAVIQFRDPGSVLSDLFTGNDTTYKVEYESGGITEWTGFVQPDSYSYAPYHQDYSSISAVDRLSRLSDLGYYQPNGDPYTGEATQPEVVARCLQYTGIDVGLGVISDWFCYLASNALTPGTHDQFYHARVKQEAFYNEDGEAYTCMAVLDTVLRAWGLQLFQSDGRWLLYQRERPYTGPADTVTRFLYTSAGAKESPAFDLPFAYVNIPTHGNGDRHLSADTRASHERAVGQYSSVYSHGELIDLFTNLTFDDSILDQSDDAGWTRAGVTSQVGNATGWAGWNGSLNSCHTDTNYEDVLTDGQDDYVWIESAHSLDAATGWKFRVPFKVRAPEWGNLPTDGREVHLYWKLRIGSSYYDYSTSSWTTADTMNSFPLHERIPAGFEDWIEFDITTPVLDGLSGKVRVEIWNSVEEDLLGVTTQSQFNILADLDEIRWITPSNEFLAAGIRTTSGINNSENIKHDDEPVVLIGDGPLNVFPGTLLLYDSTDTYVDVTSDWGKGAQSSASGDSMAQLRGDRFIKQHSQPSRTITGSILFTGETEATKPKPHHLIQITNPHNATVGDYFWQGTLVWEPLSKIPLKGTWCEVRSGDDADIGSTSNIDADGLSVPGSSVVQIFGSENLTTIDDRVTLEATPIGASDTAVLLVSINSGTTTGGGIFWGDANDTTTPTNPGTVIASSDGKRWKRLDAIQGKPWFVTWFGAVDDALTTGTDNGPAFQDTIDNAPDGQKIMIPLGDTGAYCFNTGFSFNGQAPMLEAVGSKPYWADTGYSPDFSDIADADRSGVRLYMGPSLSGPLISIDDTLTDDVSDADPANWTGGRRNGVHLKNFMIVGDWAPGVNPCISVAGAGTYGIDIVQGWGVTIEDVNVVNCQADGIRGGSGLVTTSDVCYFNRVGTHGNKGWGIQWNGSDSWFYKVRTSHNGNNDANGGGLLCGGSINYFDDLRADLNNGLGVRANGSKQNVFKGGTCDVNQWGGMHIGDGTTAVRHYQVIGMQFDGNGEDTAGTAGIAERRSGLWVNGGLGFVVHSNVCVRNHTYGMVVNGTWEDGLLMPNAFHENVFGQTLFRSKRPEGWYNALNEGVMQRTNDASSALSSLHDRVDPGAIIMFPEGNCYLAQKWTITKPLTLLGWGSPDRQGDEGSYIQGASTLDDSCVEIQSDGVVIDGINFFGSLDAGLTSAANAVRWESGTRGVMRNLLVRQFKGNGIEIGSSAQNVTLENVDVRECEASGLFSEGHNTTIKGGEYVDNGKRGVYILNADDCYVSPDTLCESNGWEGIRIDGGKRGLIKARAIGNDRAGVRIGGGEFHAVITSQVYDNGRDSALGDADRSGIYCSAGAHLHVCHNISSAPDTGANQQYGLYIGSAVQSGRFLDNQFHGNVQGDQFIHADAADVIEIDIVAQLTGVNPGSMASGAGAAVTGLTINGARVGDFVKLSPPSGWEAQIIHQGTITADDTATFGFINGHASTQDPGAGTWLAFIQRRFHTTTAASVDTFSLEMQHLYTNKNLLLDA